VKMSSRPKETDTLDTSTSVLILGGAANGVALARNFGRVGITVRAAGGKGCLAQYSRFCTKAYRWADQNSQQEFWHELLIENPKVELLASFIFALCDDSIEFVEKYKSELSQRYLLEDFNAELRGEMLDKKATLVRARAAGVDTPKFWSVETVADLQAIKGEVTFPAMVKPIHSHVFIPIFGQKLFIIESDWEELVEKLQLAIDKNCKVMVVEMVPGPDSLLSSYYTYINSENRPLFHYTKRVIRRFPMNRGGTSYHESKWLPETAEAGKKFFTAISWRGMGNIEFKRDVRDGKLKVIEVNPRFTDAHRMIVEGGMPIDEMVYRSKTGQLVPTITDYEENVRMWNPLRDFMAFRELRARGELTFVGWLESLRSGRKVLPIFMLRDPVPTFVRLREEFGRALNRLKR
jgi:D-aspartate ligase